MPTPSSLPPADTDTCFCSYCHCTLFPEEGAQEVMLDGLLTWLCNTCYKEWEAGTLAAGGEAA